MTNRWTRVRISPWLVPSLLLAVALAVYPALGHEASALVVSVGGLACVLYLASQALPLPALMPWALGMLAIEYLVSIELRGPRVDVAAPGYALVFFLCAELGWLGLEARTGGRLWLGRAVAVTVLGVAGAMLGMLLLVMTAAPVPGGPLVTGVGVAGAIGVAACLAWLAQR